MVPDTDDVPGSDDRRAKKIDVSPPPASSEESVGTPAATERVTQRAIDAPKAEESKSIELNHDTPAKPTAAVDEEPTAPTVNASIMNEKNYTITRIIAHRPDEDGKREYFVQWGDDETDCSWEGDLTVCLFGLDLLDDYLLEHGLEP